MKSFKQFDNLTESKNLHMEHLEDAVFNEGTNGVLDAIRFLESDLLCTEVVHCLPSFISGREVEVGSRAVCHD